MKKTLGVIAIIISISCSLYSQDKVTLYIAGDSTAQTYEPEKTLMRGWAQEIQQFFDQDRLLVDNRSIGGRSTGTFIAEGRWQKIVDALKPGDWVFIQFGHNDTSPNLQRYVAPDQYKANLQNMCKEAMTKGAHPCILTSIVMRTFRNGVLVDERNHFAEYIQLARDAAAELNVPLLDMSRLTTEFVRSLGDEASAELYYHVKVGDHPLLKADKIDDTHLREKGALSYARLLVEEIRARELPLASMLKPLEEFHNLALYKEIVEELSSARYQGRGYAGNGVRKAGKYIRSQFLKAGADEVVMQPYCIDINTFPGKMKMSVDGSPLAPGSQFVMREYSPGAHGEYRLFHIDTLNYDSERLFEELARPENKDVFVVCDFKFTYKHKADFSRLQSADGCQNAGLVLVWNTPLKFYKAYGEKVIAKPVIWVSSDFPKDASGISVDIDNKFLKNYESSNVIAKVSGARHDSCYVFIAHYDHLGKLGKDLYHPGANDNASGTAGIITLAEWYSANRPEFDMYFLAVSGEEANLRGSTWFVEHPLFPLESIKYLFDLDMIGDNNPVQYCEVSPEGMEGFRKMTWLNARYGFFRDLNRGELAANSDHYPFAEKGVPCILFENESGDTFPYYHTYEDNWERAVFDTYPSIFNLIVRFCK